MRDVTSISDFHLFIHCNKQNSVDFTVNLDATYLTLRPTVETCFVLYECDTA